MLNLLRYLVFLGLILLPPVSRLADGRGTNASDDYDVLLHSQSLADQRAALRAILDTPQKYVPRIQQSLRDYPRLLRADPTAAKRAIYISALVRDSSFPPILVKSLGASEVLEDCEYACPAVFALTVQSCFAGWKLPANLDSQLTTVHDLAAGIGRVSHISLKIGSIDDVVQGPQLEEHWKEIEGKNEEQLIQLAGPMTASLKTRMFAAFRLETLVHESRNRIDLYMLALNDFQDGSGEYRDAVYNSIYRAEAARARGM
ncbi:MAG TPA: hypothetical protein VEJ46_00320 [Candidatus Acidoferrum sp.]|nr:hypothetical protein [Candidatus Acidoferrum sp.]